MRNQHDIIAIKVDFDKIDQSRLFIAGSGRRYLDLTLRPSPNSRYNDSHFITMSPTQEERKNRVQLPIIGNAKVVFTIGDDSKDAPARSQPTERQQANLDDRNGNPVADAMDDVPF